MNKGLFSFLTIFIALFISAIYYTKSIQDPILSTLNTVKINYHSTLDFFGSEINKHFFQSNKIASLEAKLQRYKNTDLINRQLKQELQDLYNENNSTFVNNPNVELTRVISYQKFGDLNRVWVEIEDYNTSKIYGLIYKNLVAGIVVPKNGRALGILNQDIKSSYSVHLGKDKAPGIAHGNNGKNILVKFIPTWFKLKEGDEVITSGLDKIFFKGLKVGRVVSVTSSQGYQNAIVEPYYNSVNMNYFHLIRRLK